MNHSFVLPWPPSELSPNARHHWRKLSPMRKAYRQACAVLAIEQGAQKYPDAKGADVHMRFVPPNRARRDLDNCIASIKSGLDGLADALGMDDHKWRLSAEMAEDGEIGGMVRVTVTVRSGQTHGICSA